MESGGVLFAGVRRSKSGAITTTPAQVEEKDDDDKEKAVDMQGE